MNPFTPPERRVADPPRNPGSPVKAVVLGLLVDIGGTFLVGLIFSIGYSVVLASTGSSPEEVMTALGEIGRNRTTFLILAALGCACSVLGGYVCARISRCTDYRLGLILGILSAVIGLFMGAGNYTVFENILLNGITIVCVLMGISYGMRKPVTEN